MMFPSQGAKILTAASDRTCNDVASVVREKDFDFGVHDDEIFS